MKTTALVFSILFSFFSLAQTRKAVVTNPERLELATAIERSMQVELLDKWYPQAVDSQYGGFLSTFTYDFKPTGPQDKFIVTQARHTWSTAKAAKLFPEKTFYLQCSKNGFQFLRDV